MWTQRHITLDRVKMDYKTTDEYLKIVGNILLVTGYFVTLNFNIVLGCSMRIIATLLIMPYIFKNKIWDFAIVMGIFTSIDIHAIAINLI